MNRPDPEASDTDLFRRAVRDVTPLRQDKVLL